MNTITSLLIARAIIATAMLHGRVWPYSNTEPVGVPVVLMLLVAYLLILWEEVRTRRRAT